jgi:hypothetical protein
MYWKPEDTADTRIWVYHYTYDANGKMIRMQTGDMRPGFYSINTGWMEGELTAAELSQLKSDDDIFDYILSKHADGSWDRTETEFRY